MHLRSRFLQQGARVLRSPQPNHTAAPQNADGLWEEWAKEKKDGRWNVLNPEKTPGSNYVYSVATLNDLSPKKMGTGELGSIMEKKKIPFLHFKVCDFEIHKHHRKEVVL